jgi:hypothetical protein
MRLRCIETVRGISAYRSDLDLISKVITGLNLSIWLKGMSTGLIETLVQKRKSSNLARAVVITLITYNLKPQSYICIEPSNSRKTTRTRKPYECIISKCRKMKFLRNENSISYDSLHTYVINERSSER